MEAIKIGVDIGNYDTKTQHCQIASGYRRYTVQPQISKDYLEYKGDYYTLEPNHRMPYVMDKTQDDQCLILTLFGIAEEMIFTAKRLNNSNIQKGIDQIRVIKLGIGLPPGHFNALYKKTMEYYVDKFSDEISFIYKGYQFRFNVSDIKIFPQDFVAVYKNTSSEVAKKKRYYICGIGGGTVDVVPVEEGKPDINNFFSLEKGTRVMYRNICAEIQRQYGDMLDENLVEDVLRNEETDLPQKYISVIWESAKKHYHDIINGCIQQGVKMSLYPVVFFGGGGLLFEDMISRDDTLTKFEILDDVNANAKAYAICL